MNVIASTTKGLAMPTASSQLDLWPLNAALAGRAFAPGDGGWDAARQAWNLAVDQRPAGVVFAESAQDVAATIDFAGRQGLRVAAQGTGHGAAAVASLDDSLLLKTMRMAAVEIDVPARRARVGAGALSADVAVRAGDHGLAPLTGSSPDVGVAGFTVGGGLGWLGRQRGFACNSVLALEVVTADGRIVHADADHEPELFWALRGGGGSFGVVTALEIALYPLAEVFAGMVMFDAAEGPGVLRAYRDWAREASRAITSSVRYLCLPPLPEVPEPLRARPVIGVTAAHTGDNAEAELAAIRAAAPAVLDTFATIPAAGLCRIHGDPEQPVPALVGHTMIGELADAAIDALVPVVGAGSGSPLLQVDLRHLGGALSEPSPGAGALDALEGEFALSAVGVPMAPEHVEPIEARMATLVETLGPWSTDSGYVNFTERPGGAAPFGGETLERLRRVKARMDPDSLFRAAYEVEPAA
jgi:FAD/FMN-containing dehydrogenase